MTPDAILDARRRLFDMRELGAGNFLFHACNAFEDTQEPFLWLERPYVGPAGTVHERFSLGGLRDMTRDLAGWYAGQGIERGSHVCIYVGDGIPAFLHFLALNSLGCVPVLLNGHLDPGIARLYAQSNGFRHFVHDGETRARCEQGDLAAALDLHDAGFAEGRVSARGAPGPDWPVVARDEDDIVMICHSSGTTGVPKAVLFGHRQFFTGKRERLLDYADCTDRLATAMPPTHAAGISYLMTATMLQCPALVMAEQTGRGVADQIAGFGATIVTAFSQTYASLAALDLEPGHLSCVKRFYNTGDTAHGAHIRRMLQLAPGGQFTDMFGASELGMSQFFKTSTPNDVAAKRHVGHPADYAQCDVLTPEGEVLGTNQPGYIGVKSPTLTPGYYGQPELTALSSLNEYWLTGDIGLRLDSGEYVHLDRIVDRIDTGFGAPVYTLLLEEHLLNLPEIFDVSVTGVRRGPTREEAVVALVRPVQGKSVAAEKILAHALTCYPFADRSDLPAYSLAVGVLAEDAELPTGATGKVLKRVVRDRFWGAARALRDGKPGLLAALAWNDAQGAARQQTAKAHAPQTLMEYLSA